MIVQSIYLFLGLVVFSLIFEELYPCIRSVVDKITKGLLLFLKANIPTKIAVIVTLIITAGFFDFGDDLRDASEESEYHTIKYLLEALDKDKDISEKKWSYIIPSLFIDINSIDESFFSSSDHTALMIASKKGHMMIVKELIKSGSDLNFVDKDGNSALLIAIQNNHYLIAYNLINAGADVTLTNQYGQSALSLVESKINITGDADKGELSPTEKAQLDKILTRLKSTSNEDICNSSDIKVD